MNMEHCWNDTNKKTEVFGGNLTSVSLCPPQIPQGLAWDQTLASLVRDKQLTACAMHDPLIKFKQTLWRMSIHTCTLYVWNIVCISTTTHKVIKQNLKVKCNEISRIQTTYNNNTNRTLTCNRTALYMSARISNLDSCNHYLIWQ